MGQPNLGRADASFFPTPPGHAAAEFSEVSKTVPQFPGTFFGITGMHMLHVTIGVIYLGNCRVAEVVHSDSAWTVAGGLAGTPDYSPFHYGAHLLLISAIVCGVIVWLKPRFTTPRMLRWPGCIGTSSTWCGCSFSRWFI